MDKMNKFKYIGTITNINGKWDSNLLMPSNFSADCRLLD
jgi:hypothetical protein